MAPNTTLNVFCSICSDQFCIEEIIWSLSCGHVFHGNCIQNWHGRNFTCPECRTPSPNKCRIYLNLMNSEPESASGSSLNEDSLVKRISLLERKLEENEKNFYEATLALTAAETRVQDLSSELEIKRACIESYDQKFLDFQFVLEDSETNLLNSLGELSKTESALQEKQKFGEPKSPHAFADIATPALSTDTSKDI